MFEEAEKRIEQILSGWTETPIDWDNVYYDEEVHEPFVRLQIEWVQADRISMATDRHLGYIMLSVFVPSGTGPRESARLCDNLAAMFKIREPGFQFFPATIQRVGERDGFYQRNLLIKFYYDNCEVTQ